MEQNRITLTAPAERPVHRDGVARRATAPPRVLVVEDDGEMRDWVEETLRSAGYQTVGAGDALTAVVILLGNGVDLIVTDWRMPTMDGLELLDAVRRCSPGTPVVFVTAFPDGRLRRAALERGACCFLPKPFRGGQLVEQVRSALDRRAA
jgi:DNA-binding response OmpR family regulator